MAPNGQIQGWAPRLEFILRGSAIGFLAGTQGFGNLGASAIAGIIWTAVSPSAAFAYLAAWMVVAVAAISAARRPR